MLEHREDLGPPAFDVLGIEDGLHGANIGLAARVAQAVPHKTVREMFFKRETSGDRLLGPGECVRHFSLLSRRRLPPTLFERAPAGRLYVLGAELSQFLAGSSVQLLVALMTLLG